MALKLSLSNVAKWHSSLQIIVANLGASFNKASSPNPSPTFKTAISVKEKSLCLSPLLLVTSFGIFIKTPTLPFSMT